MAERRTVRRACLVALVACAGALGACGGDDGDRRPAVAGAAATSGYGTAVDATTKATTKATTLKLDAVERGDSLAFSKKKLSARAGRVTVRVRNPQGNTKPHAVEVEGKGVEKAGKVVKAGGISTVTLALKPGKYDYYCPVDQHRQAGMEGKLTVR